MAQSENVLNIPFECRVYGIIKYIDNIKLFNLDYWECVY